MATGTTEMSELDREYSALSLRDLVDAREQYHIHLMRLPNVVATAIGYYRIRNEDTPPGAKRHVKGTGVRTLTNSQIRAYSWPAVLVFVEDWVPASDFAKGGKYSPDSIVPKTLYMPDGRRVPVCIIQAPRDITLPDSPPFARYPLNNLGSGQPVTITVQGREHFATVACLVTDGHRTFALTNRHVTGEAGEIVMAPVGGRDRQIGVSAPLDATRVPFGEIYPGWTARSVFVNLDVGLIDVDRIDDWTARLKDGSLMGPMVDLSSTSFPLSLVGSQVKGWGAASGLMHGEIHGLFYRYKSRGGFEYVSDFFIGPSSRGAGRQGRFTTQPGDSGTLWLLEPPEDVGKPEKDPAPPLWRPLAVQWGANRLYSALTDQAQAFALATCLSTVCERLDVDVIRDWNLDQPDTWGAVGHFAIASRTAAVLSPKVPKLAKLMQNNRDIITHDDQTILTDDFKGMGDDAFVPLADVPDFFWKHGKQGAARHFEGPNHFADMDQKRPKDNVDLLALCKDDANIDPKVWNSFYDSVKDLGTGQAITPEHRGLLPFRVWQIFDGMVRFASAGRDENIEKFVCAAGVLAHYIGDACQPLHISYLHDGDPLRGKKHTVHHHDGTTSDVIIPLGAGVHSAYEDGMVNSHRKDILNGLDKTPRVKPSEYVTSGKEAALRTIELMRNTFDALKPDALVAAYAKLPDKKKANDELWRQFGKGTIAVMKDGVHLLAVLWESAWVQGKAESRKVSTSALNPKAAMKICADPKFLASCSIEQIGAELADS